MAEIKLTKNALREEETKLKQLKKYLPTLQLKKAMLQVEVQQAKAEIARLQELLQDAHKRVNSYSALFSEVLSFEWEEAVQVEKVHKKYENIAGVEVPLFQSVDFQKVSYYLVDTPPWVDGALRGWQEMVTEKMRVEVQEEKKEALKRELREVSIRVNLFEKILIPRAQRNIRKIKVFLGDQELAAVSQAKVAKGKIEAHRHAH